MALPGHDTSLQFGPVTKFLHWITFLLVASLVGLGWYMVDLPLEPETFEIYALHKSIGITVLGLTVIRIVWRIINPRLAILGDTRPWERFAARLTHRSLYVVLLAIPTSGWILSSAADFPVIWFGLFELPNLVSPGDELRELTTIVHRTLGQVLLALLVLHILAALRHHYINKDKTLVRMLPNLGREE